MKVRAAMESSRPQMVKLFQPLGLLQASQRALAEDFAESIRKSAIGWAEYPEFVGSSQRFGIDDLADKSGYWLGKVGTDSGAASTGWGSTILQTGAL
jgi:hypothetical protein